MAIRPDHEIWSLIQSRRLKIDPIPDLDAVSPSTIDLTLAHSFQVLEDSGETAMDMAIDSRDSKQVMKALDRFSENFTVKDGD